jgi:hypothetical protein
MKKVIFLLIKVIYGSIFFIGFSLLFLNILGEFSSLRSPSVTDLEHFPNDITITENQFYQIILERDSSDRVYIEKVTMAVNGAIAHYWAGPSQFIENEEDVKKYNLEMPVWENYLLYFLYKFAGVEDTRYEFCDYKKAIERGVGFCSQQTLILDAILDEHKIESKIITFPFLHVLETALVEKENEVWWVFDPDFGVVIEHDIQMISQNPEIIRPYYSEAGYDNDLIDYLVFIFGTKYQLHESVDAYFGKTRCSAERITYLVKWILPVILLLIGSLPFIRKPKGSY